MAVLVISASGYSRCLTSVVRIVIASRHILEEGIVAFKMGYRRRNKFWRMSRTTCPGKLAIEAL
jgi:hypothetical protein